MAPNRLVYKFLTESDNWSAVVDKINYNFDQNKAFGGGDKGDIGKEGLRGLPGATGIGKIGNTGLKGATIAFVQVALVDGQQVTDPSLRLDDVVIDSNGSFYSIIKNNVGDLIYKFQYSLASAVAGSIVETENQVASQSTNPIVKWFLRATGNPKDSNALFVDRVIGTVTDEAQLYRVVLGDSGYTLLQNATLTLINILPSAVAVTAKDKFFAQLAFKYRGGPAINSSSNTGYLRYLELNKNETTPAGPDDTYMIIDNISAGFGAVHDSLTSDASYAVVRGRNTRFVGKTAIDQLYQSGALNSASAYMEVVVDPSQVLLHAPGYYKIESLTAELSLAAATLMSFNSPKNFFRNSLYIGNGNYSGSNTYAPANGAVVEGAVGIGYTSAPYNGDGTMLAVNGPIYTSSGVVIFSGVVGNLEHVWVDDRNDIPGVGGLFHMVADAAFKADGNAGLKIGRLFTNQIDSYDSVIIGDSGWTPGLSKGLSVQGRSFFNDITEANGKFFSWNDSEFHGTVAMETNNFYTRVASQVDLRGGDKLYLGATGINYSIWRYYNTGGARYEYLGFRSDINDWVATLNNVERRLWHSGNQGPGSGLNADLLDGIDSTGFVRFGVRSDGDYVWIRSTNPSLAFAVTQQNGGAPIQRWFAGGGDGSEKASLDYNGILSAVDFNITSDRRLKKNIKSIKTAKDIINALNPVTFNWKNSLDTRSKASFVAQEVKEILPDAVSELETGMSISNSHLIPFLVKGLQEAFAEIELLKKKLTEK